MPSRVGKKIEMTSLDELLCVPNGESKGKEFRTGAELCLKKALEENIDLAILQLRSPFCGVKQIYNGSFSGKLIDGRGVFAQLMVDNGIRGLDLEDVSVRPD